jgi:hypothetical protein
MSTAQQLKQLADARRRELIPYVYEHTQGQVQKGPFQGQKIVPHVMWGDGDTVGKLMGEYENELHDFIEDAIAQQPDAVINVGSAEGYYSIGFACRLPDTTVLALDIDARAAAIVKMNAEANGAANVQAITQRVDPAWLQSNLINYKNPLVISDCEGYELTLLDPVAVPALVTASILVESHDCITAGITETLEKRFANTHNVQIVAQKTKDPYTPEWTHALSDCDKWCLVHEGRPSTMRWLYMTPKK